MGLGVSVGARGAVTLRSWRGRRVAIGVAGLAAGLLLGSFSAPPLARWVGVSGGALSRWIEPPVALASRAPDEAGPPPFVAGSASPATAHFLRAQFASDAPAAPAATAPDSSIAAPSDAATVAGDAVAAPSPVVAAPGNAVEASPSDVAVSTALAAAVEPTGQDRSAILPPGARPYVAAVERWRPLVRQTLSDMAAGGLLAGPARALDEDLVLAVIQHESAGDPDAVSDAGAVGLMQLMPETFVEMLGLDPTLAASAGLAVFARPPDNVRAGVRYLAEAMRSQGGSLYWTLSSYNAGIGAVDEWRSVGLPSVPPIGGYTETANYAPAILRTYNRHHAGSPAGIPAPMSDDQAAQALRALQQAGLW